MSAHDHHHHHHGHGHHHSPRHRPVPQASLLRTSAAARLLGVAVVVAALWASVYWALQS
jgi:hypothetical protein